MNGPGIDYGMGATNRDVKTGIRYGVISLHSVSQVWSEESEADYGGPCCPKCGDAPVDCFELDVVGSEFEVGRGCADYACVSCEYVFDSSEAFGDEPIGWELDDGEYKATDCLDSDIMILESPYYTLALFCSPCVPGAGNLDNADSEGVQTYCFGHDWFEEGKAPYLVYRVSDGSLVEEPVS